MTSIAGRVATGTVAGAAGTLALDAATYADMALRGRPASSTPQRTVQRVAELLGLPLPEDPDRREARLTGLGALLGMGAGVSAGIALALLGQQTRRRGLPATSGTAFGLAMLVGNGPMTALGICDPRAWTRVDWAADVVPHLAYAAAAAATLRGLDRA